MKTFSIILILGTFTVSCTRNLKTENISILHINIPVNKIEQVKMSDIISEFKVIKLEFTDQSMIGDIQKITVHNGLIYVLDTFGAKSLMVFDINGKFIRKIGSLGKGPGQYLLPKDFIIDTDNDEIEIIDNQKINIFLSNGKYLKDYKIDFASTDFEKLGDNYFLAAGGLEDHYIYKTDNNFKIIEKYIRTAPKSVLGNAFRPFINKNELHFLFRPLIGDTIYSVSQERAVPIRIVDFGKYKINYEEFLSKAPMERAKIVICQSNVNQCVMIRYFENDSYIHIIYNMSSKYYQYIYNKKTGSEIHFDKESLTDDITWEKNSWNLLVGADDEYFYYLIQPYKYHSTNQLRKFLESFTNDEEYIHTMLHETSNPIILMAKYKI